MRILQISVANQQKIIAHLRSALPHEGCGFLSGVESRVVGVWPIANLAASPTRFRMEPAAQVATLLAIEASGETLLAIYHSHPHGPMALSPEDVMEAYDPNIIQVLGVPDGNIWHLQAFGITDGKVTEVQLLPDD